MQVSVLGFGGAPAGLLATDAAQVATLVNHLLDSGVNVIDTAAMYNESESFIGQHLSHRRGDFVLISKCGHKVKEIDAPAWSPRLIAATVDRALRRLRTDIIDVMLLHTCDLTTLQQGDALAALVKARDAGKIRHTGFSGDNDAAVFAASIPDIAVIETSVNLVEQANAAKVLPAARQHNIGIIAKRPIANAAWKLLDEQPVSYRNYVKQYTERFAQLKITPAELGFGGDPRVAWPEIALRFTLSYRDVHTAIIGTTNPANAAANVEYARRGPLSDAATAELRRAYGRIDGADRWPGLT